MAGVILEKLIVSTIIILLASLGRIMIKNRFGFLWRKILWCMIAVWMLLPISFSFGKKAGYHGEILLLSRADAIEAGYSLAEYVPDSGNTLFRAIPLVYYVMILSVIVAMIKIVYHYRQYGFFVNKLIGSTTAQTDEKILFLWQRVCREQNIRRKIPVYRSNMKYTPMIMGCFSPVLILPENFGMEQEPVIYDVLCHEAVHYKSGDLWYKKLLLLVSDLYWFHPLVYLMRKFAYEDVEFACDEQVTKGFDDEEKRRYCNSILNMADVYGSPNIYAVEFSVDARKLKSRLENVFSSKGKKQGIAVLIGFIVIFVLAAGWFDIQTKDKVFTEIRSREDIEWRMAAIKQFYFDENEKLGEVAISYKYDLEDVPVNNYEIGEYLHIVVACERYDELSDIMLEGIEAVFTGFFGCDSMDIQIMKLEH